MKTTMIKMIIAVLGLSLVGNAATRWVDPANGNDTTGSTDIGHPYKTINAAKSASGANDVIKLLPGTYDDSTQGAAWRILTTYNSGNGVTLTIESSDNTDRILTTTYTGNFIDLAGTGTWILRHLDLRAPSSTAMIINCAPAKVVNMYNCKVTCPIYGVYRAANGGVALGSLTIEDCEIITGRSPVTIRDVTTTTIRRTKLRHTTHTDYSGLAVYGVCPTIELDKLDITSVFCGVAIDPTADIETFILKNDSSIVAAFNGISAHDVAIDSFDCFDSYIESTGIGAAILVGKDVPPSTKVTNNVRIINNKFHSSKSSGFGGHACFAGFGVKGGVIAENTITGAFNYGIVVKGDHVVVYKNIDHTANPMGIYQGAYNVVIENTLIGKDAPNLSPGNGSALVIGDHVTGTYTHHNTILRNILVVPSGVTGGTGVISYCLADDGNAGSGEDYIERNCYFREDGGDVAYLHGDGRTFAELKNAWGNYNVAHPTNDANSSNENPQLDSEYRQMNTNLWNLHMGAWRPYYPIELIYGGVRGRRMFYTGIPKAEFMQ